MQKEQDVKVLVACEHAVNLLVMQQNLKKKFAKAVASQTKYYDLKHFPKIFAVKDFEYLNSKNINSTKPSQKLD